MSAELLLGAVVGTAVALGAAAVAGWYARSKSANATEALLRDEIEELNEEVDALQESLGAQRRSASLVLDAARRRADYDSDTDHLGLGLLLGGQSLDPAASGEAEPGDGTGPSA